MRQRPAPIAARIAISFRRAVARATNRLAIFAHAISSTNATAPNRIQSVSRTVLPTSTTIIERIRMPLLEFESGYCFLRLAAMLFMSAWACAAVVPGFRRATAYSPG